MTPGESVKFMRELHELSQAELADKCGIPKSTISGIESGRINLGVDRAKALARSGFIPRYCSLPDGIPRRNRRLSMRFTSLGEFLSQIEGSFPYNFFITQFGNC